MPTRVSCAQVFVRLGMSDVELRAFRGRRPRPLGEFRAEGCDVGSVSMPFAGAEPPLRLLDLLRTNVTQRTNVAVDDDGNRSKEDLWRLVPGDLVTIWRPGHFDSVAAVYSERQRTEQAFYGLCSICRRTPTQISAEPPAEQCQIRICGRERAKTPPPGDLAA